jgi:hypothetical protein
MSGAEELALTLLAYESIFIPEDGVTRAALLEGVMRAAGLDLTHGELSDAMRERVRDETAHALALMDAGMPPALALNAILVVEWSLGFAVGVFHAQRLADGPWPAEGLPRDVARPTDENGER